MKTLLELYVSEPGFETWVKFEQILGSKIRSDAWDLPP